MGRRLADDPLDPSPRLSRGVGGGLNNLRSNHYILRALLALAAYIIGLYHCAPWGAEGASISERRGQISLSHIYIRESYIAARGDI